jgi:hypothetical protein
VLGAGLARVVRDWADLCGFVHWARSPG